MKTRPILFFIPCFIALACDKDIYIEIAKEPPVVVNSLFNPDSTWRVRVDKAWSMNEAFYELTTDGPTVMYAPVSKAIQDASVNITSARGEQITLAYDTNGYYISPLKPEAGESYMLSVQVPGEARISSLVTLPEPVQVDTAYVTIVAGSNLLVTVEFTDIPGPTAYEISVAGTTYNSFMECDDPDVHVETYWTPDKYLDNGATMGPIFLGMSDRNFQGQKKKLVVSIIGEPTDVWTVRLRTLSDEYAQYRATSVQQQDAFNDPFAQPVQVYSNIANGVGIFAGYSVSQYNFKGY